MDESFFQHDPEKEKTPFIEEEEKLDIQYVPQELLHRRKEMAKLRRSFWKKAIGGDQAQVIVTGDPGTGKTVTIRYYIQKLRENNDFEDTQIVYINARSNSSEEYFLMAFFEELGLEYKRGVNPRKNIMQLRQEAEEGNLPQNIVLALDEIDHLNKKHTNHLNGVIEKIAEPNLIFGEKNDIKLSFIGISNKHDIKEQIDKDVKSRLDEKTIHFDKYTKDELTEILSRRQEEAFSDQILSEKALELLAEEIRESFDCDVRIGLQILKNAPDKVSSSNLNSPKDIDEQKVIEEAIRDVKESRIEDLLRRGGDEHFVILMKSITKCIDEEINKLQEIIKWFNAYCEYAMIEKKNTEDATKTYVYRELNKMVRKNMMERKKNSNEKHSPYYYYLKTDNELLKEKVDEKMKRMGIWEDFEQGYKQQHDSAMDKAENKIQSLMGN